jgi:ATP-dependent RNA helicase DeaD
MPFSSLPNLISQALAEQGYAEPTPVQAAVLGAEAHDRDLVSAQTGSGKTVAFGVAMAARLLSEDNGFNRAPGALVIAPTRELALQVSRELTWLFGKAGIRITTCVGGMDAARERRTLAQGTHVVVGTPGRLRDHLERGALDLSALHHVVLDEADEMLDMGFREDLEEILEATPEGRRTLLFSATMPKPIVALARRYQRDALRISTVSDNVGHGDITYQAVAVSPADIENAVINLLRFHEAETAILFCATRDSIRHLHSSLIERGFAAVALSGEHSQNERNNALQALRDGRARICVATDVAARGIDIPSLSLVIHVEVPRDAEVLQHRSGRTGRAGRKGVAVMIALPASSPGRRHAPHRPRHRRMGAGPEPGSIRERDRERLLADLLQPIRSSDADRDLAERILAAMSPTDVALALVQARKRGIPDPEELIEQSQADAPVRGARREGFDDVVWFRMDIGRRQNADPRWLLPLLCRRGHITRNEIGAIRIAANETYFQVPSAIEAKFRAALKRTANPGSDDEAASPSSLRPKRRRTPAATARAALATMPVPDAVRVARPRT